MRWYSVFIKSAREQLRDYWILIMVVILAPFMLFMYYLMVETEEPDYDVVFVNQDWGGHIFNIPVNLGDSLIHYMQLGVRDEGYSFLNISREANREDAEALLHQREADVLIVLPENLTSSLMDFGESDSAIAWLELVGDVTDMEYLVGAVWTEEIINHYVQEFTGITLPLKWKETSLGFSGQRSEFELYVSGLLILSIIMMMFSASAAFVREPETKTLDRLKISKLSSLEFLSGISLLQIVLAVLSLVFALLTAVGLGYTIIPGTLWFIFLIGILTSLSMITFSLIVASICRSIKDVAIIGTFPLFLLMFFSGAAYPISGGKLFSIGKLTLHINDILSPTWAVDALNKVLIKGQDARETTTEILALVILTILYFIIGVWAFRRRHMRAH
jgi:ABC-2 type transport system permease protein